MLNACPRGARRDQESELNLLLRFLATCWVSVLFLLWFVLLSAAEFFAWLAHPAHEYLEGQKKANE